MIMNETYELNNGVRIPKVGLGTWFISDGDAAGIVRDAAKVGYRLIDTAEAYANEAGVGEGIRTCGVPREDMFVTTKIVAEAKTYEAAERSIEGSLDRMGLDYVDLIIIHAPQPWNKWRDRGDRYFEENVQVWRAMEEAYGAGKLKAIGVSNFLVDDMQNILDNCEIRPAVNQILNHPGNVPEDVIDFCKENGILVESYSPFGHGEVLKSKDIEKIAKGYGVSAPQLCMRFVVQMGTVAIPKATSVEHMRNNTDIDFDISAEDMDRLKNIRFGGYGEMEVMPVFSGKD